MTLYEPFNPFFIESKKIFLSKEGQLMYKLRAIPSEGTFSDNPHAKCNMSFDPIKLEFTCLYNQKLKVDGIIEKDDELNSWCCKNRRSE